MIDFNKSFVVGGGDATNGYENLGRIHVCYFSGKQFHLKSFAENGGNYEADKNTKISADMCVVLKGKTITKKGDKITIN